MVKNKRMRMWISLLILVVVVGGVLLVKNTELLEGRMKFVRGFEGVKGITSPVARGSDEGSKVGLSAEMEDLTRCQLAELVIEQYDLDVPGNYKFVDFPDLVGRNAWCLPHAQEMEANGLMMGNADGTFGPKEAVSRAQLYKIVSIAAGLPLADCSYSEHVFSDVEEDAWYTDSVDTLLGWGVIKVNEGMDEIKPDAAAKYSYAVTLINNSKNPEVTEIEGWKCG